MKITRVIGVVFVSGLLGGCSFGANKMDEFVAESVKSCRIESSCTVDFREFLASNWDVMFVLPESIEDSAIEKITGVGYSGDKDAGRLVLFLSDGEIVYDQLDHLGGDGRTVHFPREEKMEYLPHEAVFLARRQSDSIFLKRSLRGP